MKKSNESNSHETHPIPLIFFDSRVSRKLRRSMKQDTRVVRVGIRMHVNILY